MKTSLFLFSLAFCFLGTAQEGHFDYFPKSNAKYQLIKHENYALAYSEEHEQAAWVAYELTKSEVTTKVVDRTDDYREDPNCPSGSATLEDYKYSGYDRGHLAPASDFKFSYKAMSESFYLTNMCPQKAEFNREIWLDLEVRTRSWAYQKNALHVIVGPIFEENLKTIGPNKVAVPNYYYKILLDLPQKKAIAFLMKNQASTFGLHNFVVPIDSIEALSGIDFFPSLDDSLETVLETSVSTTGWFYDFEEYPRKQNTETSSQCLGIAKSTGKRCRITFNLTNGFCRYHQGQRESSLTK